MSDNPRAPGLAASAAAAEAYYNLGWWPIPLPCAGDGRPADGKNPAMKDWGKQRITGDEAGKFFGSATNVGLILGEASGHLTDVDLDCIEAARCGPHLLPPTPMRHGRKSVPCAHYWYKCPGIKVEKFLDPEDGKTLIEVRYGKERALQTVVPPSRHMVTGETLFWLDTSSPARPVVGGVKDALPFLKPASVEPQALLSSARRVAAVACLARSLPADGRHEIGFSVVGMLLRGGMKSEDVKRLVQIILNAAGMDDKRDDWLRTLEDSARRHAAGEEMKGAKSLAEFIGEKRVGKIREWLGLNTGSLAYGEQGRQAGTPAATGDPEGGGKKLGLNPVPLEISIRLQLHDLGNAQRYVAAFGGGMLYCGALNGWFIWDKDSGCWRKDDKNLAQLRAAVIAKQLEKEADSERDFFDQQWRKFWALTTQRQSVRLKSMVEISAVSQHCAAVVDDFDQHPWRLALPGATLDLSHAGLTDLFETGSAPTPDLKLRLTKLGGCVWDADSECPLWLKFLDRIFGGDPELIAYMQRQAGYFLFGGNPEQVMPIWYGEGANGKSTFMGCCMGIMGEYASTISKDALLSRENAGNNQLYALASVRGTRLVVCSETKEGGKLDEETVKALASSEPVPARYSHQNFFTFVPQFTPVLITNHKPRIAGTNEGIWRRVHLDPFMVRIPDAEQDTALDVKLKAEWPGILRWMLCGLLAWHQNRARTGRGLQPPDSVLAATQEYRDESNPLGNFIEDCCTLDEYCATTKGRLYDGYKLYADGAGIWPLYKNKLSQVIAKLPGVKDGPRGIARTWIGVQLNAAAEAALDAAPPPRSYGGAGGC